MMTDKTVAKACAECRCSNCIADGKCKTITCETCKFLSCACSSCPCQPCRTCICIPITKLSMEEKITSIALSQTTQVNELASILNELFRDIQKLKQDNEELQQQSAAFGKRLAVLEVNDEDDVAAEEDDDEVEAQDEEVKAGCEGGSPTMAQKKHLTFLKKFNGVLKQELGSLITTEADIVEKLTPEEENEYDQEWTKLISFFGQRALKIGSNAKIVEMMEQSQVMFDKRQAEQVEQPRDSMTSGTSGKVGQSEQVEEVKEEVLEEHSEEVNWVWFEQPFDSDPMVAMKYSKFKGQTVTDILKRSQNGESQATKWIKWMLDHPNHYVRPDSRENFRELLDRIKSFRDGFI